MKIFTKKILNNLSIFLLIYLFAGVTFLKAAKYEVINITGNKRLSVETILMFSGLKIDADIEKDELMIHPFDDMDIIDGQSTIGLEIFPKSSIFI